jgi:hypothetical protein
MIIMGLFKYEQEREDARLKEKLKKIEKKRIQGKKLMIKI